MADYRVERSLGARIQAARNLRGLNTRELAAAINDGKVTDSVIENIETGRKANADVSLILSIAMALDLPPSYLLAPLGNPDAGLDLPNLSPAFDGMTVAEFEAWLTRPQEDLYRSPSLNDLNAATELRVLRAWIAQRRETARLEAILAVETENGIRQHGGPLKPSAERIQDSVTEEKRLKAYLTSAGWSL